MHLGSVSEPLGSVDHEFGSDPDSAPGGDGPLMWVHYADGHRGLCIELALDADPEWRRRTRAVEYCTDVPALNGSARQTKTSGTRLF